MSQSFERAIAQLQGDDLLRTPRTVTPLPGGRCRIGRRELWNFTTNDYLDLASDPRLVDAARRALDACGVGARASALVSGRTEWHERLEERLAVFEGCEAALLFPSGYAANVGTVSAIVHESGTVLCDRINHASLVDGCRASGARLRVYRHDDLQRLRAELMRVADGHETWIVTDGVFSMDGTLAPLPELVALAEEHAARVLVDEAHGTGVFGARGRGTSEYLGVEHRVDVRVGTLSKAIGCLGGFVTGPRAMIEWLRNAARTQIYSTALPPAICAAATTALDVVDEEPQRRAQLLARSEFLRRELRRRGVDLPPDGGGPILAIVVGEAGDVVEVGGRLEERGFLVSTIRPPTVPRGTARLRISLTVAHDEPVLAELASAVAEVGCAVTELLRGTT